VRVARFHMRNAVLPNIKHAYLKEALAATASRSTTRVHVSLSRPIAARSIAAARALETSASSSNNRSAAPPHQHGQNADVSAMRGTMWWQLTQALRDVPLSELCHADQGLRVTFDGEGGRDEGVRVGSCGVVGRGVNCVGALRLHVYKSLCEWCASSLMLTRVTTCCVRMIPCDSRGLDRGCFERPSVRWQRSFSKHACRCSCRLPTPWSTSVVDVICSSPALPVCLPKPCVCSAPSA